MQKSIKKFGLIGYNIDYSFSKKFFEEKFINEKIINCSYENFDINSIELILDIIKDNNIKGLNVTIPYKESIIEYLNYIDPIAKKIGAVNTIKIDKKNKLSGYNTDYIGFKKTLNNKNLNHKKALILGAGGASKAIIHALEGLKVKSTIVSRTPSSNTILYEEINKNIIQDNTIIVNCTPVGTFPKVDECPNIPYKYISKNHLCYDLIYNPIKTKFLIKSEKAGAEIINGKKMLENQANESWRIWNS